MLRKGGVEQVNRLLTHLNRLYQVGVRFLDLISSRNKTTNQPLRWAFCPVDAKLYTTTTQVANQRILKSCRLSSGDCRDTQVVLVLPYRSCYNRSHQLYHSKRLNSIRKRFYQMFSKPRACSENRPVRRINNSAYCACRPALTARCRWHWAVSFSKNGEMRLQLRKQP